MSSNGYLCYRRRCGKDGGEDDSVGAAHAAGAAYFEPPVLLQQWQLNHSLPLEHFQAGTVPAAACLRGSAAHGH
eukprot:764524-Hanusia_phi.AAC.1